MIKPGWTRDVCPQCRMPGRLGEVYLKAYQQVPGATKITSITPMVFQGPNGWSVKVDICINCGVMYAHECVQTAQLIQGMADDGTPEA